MTPDCPNAFGSIIENDIQSQCLFHHFSDFFFEGEGGEGASGFLEGKSMGKENTAQPAKELSMPFFALRRLAQMTISIWNWNKKPNREEKLIDFENHFLYSADSYSVRAIRTSPRK
jgi:hypothetical protein